MSVVKNVSARQFAEGSGSGEEGQDPFANRAELLQLG
jgi:hypothetical protein